MEKVNQNRCSEGVGTNLEPCVVPRKGEGESEMMSMRLHTPPSHSHDVQQKVFPVINKSTVGSAAVHASASDPDGSYSLTSHIKQEQGVGGGRRLCAV